MAKTNIQSFIDNNYLVFKNENKSCFDLLYDSVSSSLSSKLGVDGLRLNKLHHFIKREDLNSLRLEAFKEVNALHNWESLYYSLAKSALKELIGPDISIQIKLNLSIQMPNDETSLLLLHSDTLSGQSPYELVLWTALTDAYDSNAMYIFSATQSRTLYQKLPLYQHKGMSKLFDDNSVAAKPLNVTRGTCILFSSTLFHGNRLNETNDTRVSLNCRFKALFSPEYSRIPHERVTGTFYKPLYKSPLTEIGLNYNDDIKF
jgi:sporadic carbohydrate cluster 2OG-Fe(II) oxygenase